MAPGRIDLRHAVVAVTGAARGIGLATAELFLQAWPTSTERWWPTWLGR